MQVLTVANQKGGVGKTTTAVSLGGLLAEAGAPVLLVDIDPHTSLTAYFGIDADDLEASVFDCLNHPEWSRYTVKTRAIVKTGVENLDLLPGSVAMATLDRQLSNLEGKGFLLNRLLGKLTDDYEYVFIDCPPVLGILMVNALAACARLLIPCQTEPLALKGLERMIQTVRMVARAGRDGFSYTIIPTMFDRRTRASVKALRSMRDTWPDCLWHGVIPVDTKFRDASAAHVPLNTLDPNTHGIEGYRRLLRDLEQGRLPEAKAGHEPT
ncbi:MAG: ParA family protein [Gammaproteobacteria bacterium]|nr:MAG: ParA family protein [Gammaproteobacteria bacterium]